MSLKTILKNQIVHQCKKSATVDHVVKMMKDNDIGSIVVEDHNKPIGIITDRDLVLRCMTEGKKGFEMKAEDLMTTPVETLPESSGLFAAIELMTEKKIRRLCLVNETGQCTNVISFGDIMELWAAEMGRLASAIVPCKEKLVKHKVA